MNSLSLVTLRDTPHRMAEQSRVSNNDDGR